MWLLFKEEFEDTKGVIRIRISKKNRQHNGQKKKDKQRSIKHTQKRADKIYVLLFIAHVKYKRIKQMSTILEFFA
jgi:hypothetical protein